MDLYLMYLRKSRADRDFIEDAEEQTLKRHRRILETLAEKNHYYIAEVIEEVVSGKYISLSVSTLISSGSSL